MKLEWESSNPWFQRAGVPYIPSDIIDVESFVPVGGFSKMRTVRAPRLPNIHNG